MIDRVIVEPVCFHCRWFLYFPFCGAFPGGIPDDIRLGLNDHRLPVDGDHGLQFTPLDDSGMKEGRFVTLGDGGEQRVVFIDGPAQGAGGTVPRSEDVPAGVTITEMSIKDEFLASRRVSEYGGDVSYEVSREGSDYRVWMSASDINKITPQEFDPDLEYGRIRFTIDRVREVLKKHPDFVSMIDRDGDIMVSQADRKVGTNIIFTADNENVGAGSGGPGSAKVFWLPYEYRDRENFYGFQSWSRLGVDPLYVLVHELHHAFGSSSELDLFSDVMAVDVHLQLGNTMAPGSVASQVDHMLLWARQRASGKWKEDILIQRKAMRWLYDMHTDDIRKILTDKYEDGDEMAKRISRW